MVSLSTTGLKAAQEGLGAKGKNVLSRGKGGGWSGLLSLLFNQNFILTLSVRLKLWLLGSINVQRTIEWGCDGRGPLWRKKGSILKILLNQLFCIFFRDFNAKNVLLRDACTQAERGCGKDWPIMMSTDQIKKISCIFPTNYTIKIVKRLNLYAH